MEAVKGLRGCPRIVRGNQGAENVEVRDLQRFLHNSAQINKQWLCY